MTLKEERELKKAAKLEAEKQRIEAMREYEEMYDTFSYICGIDEAGRGPLAGPVVAGAVILPKGKRILYVNDSKKLSEKKRDELFDVIKEEALSYESELYLLKGLMRLIYYRQLMKQCAKQLINYL